MKKISDPFYEKYAQYFSRFIGGLSYWDYEIKSHAYPLIINNLKYVGVSLCAVTAQYETDDCSYWTVIEDIDGNILVDAVSEEECILKIQLI